MSAQLATFKSCSNDKGCRDMSLTAYCGGKNGRAIQFTIGPQFCSLNEKQLEDLVALIYFRLRIFQATGDSLDLEIEP